LTSLAQFEAFNQSLQEFDKRVPADFEAAGK